MQYNDASEGQQHRVATFLAKRVQSRLIIVRGALGNKSLSSYSLYEYSIRVHDYTTMQFAATDLINALNSLSIGESSIKKENTLPTPSDWLVMCRLTTPFENRITQAEMDREGLNELEVAVKCLSAGRAGVRAVASHEATPAKGQFPWPRPIVTKPSHVAANL